MYTCVLELRLSPAAYCKSMPCFYNNIVFLYDFVCYLYTFMPYIYQKNNIGTAQEGHLHNPYCISIIRLTRGHPSPDVGSHLNLLRYSELHNYFNGITPFSLDILTRSNTLKLFPFLLFLPGVFLYSH